MVCVVVALLCVYVGFDRHLFIEQARYSFPNEGTPWFKCVPGVTPPTFSFHVILITQSPRAVKTFS